jgi:serine protease Do
VSIVRGRSRNDVGARTAARRRALPLARTTVTLAAGLLVTGLVAPPLSLAATGTVQPATRIADRTYPGVQLIETDFTATLSVPDGTMDEAAFSRLQDRLTRQALSGAVDATEAALVEAIVDEIAKAPLTYFKPSSTMRHTTATVSGFGTGWVVTPDGYMVTAAHVVNPDPAEIKQAFAESALNDFVTQDAQSLQQGSGAQFTPDQIKKLTDAAAAFDAHYLSLGPVTKSVSAQIGVGVAGFKKMDKGKPIEVVSAGEPYPGKDVAVLKLDGEQHLPTLPVGQNADVAAGDTLYVAGYPAASTFYSGLSKDSQVQPTVTQGPLTAVKSNPAGTPIFQTQAPASPGNSGGPVLDDAGKVVGILVASAVDDKGNALEGQEFVIPASVVTEKLNQSNVHPTASDTTTLYGQALDAYYQQYYSRALPLFQQVSNLYPGHPYVEDFITKSQSAINAGQDKTPAGVTGMLLIGGVALVVVLIVVLLLVLLLRRRRKGATPAAGVPGTAPFAQPGPGYPQQGQPQPGYPQAAPGYPQAAPGYPQAAPGYPQAAPGYPQAAPGYPQAAPGYPQQGQPQPGYPQPGLPQQGQPQPGYPQQGQPAPGYPQQGQPAPGYPQPGSDQPQAVAPQQVPPTAPPAGYPVQQATAPLPAQAAPLPTPAAPEPAPTGEDAERPDGAVPPA